MMECEICGEFINDEAEFPEMYTCPVCGRQVCSSCFDHECGECVYCVDSIRIEDPEEFAAEHKLITDITGVR